MIVIYVIHTTTFVGVSVPAWTHSRARRLRRYSRWTITAPIRRARRDGESIRQIAPELNLSRFTIRKVLKNPKTVSTPRNASHRNSVPSRRSSTRSSPRTRPHPQATAEAARAFRGLRDEDGYCYGHSRVQHFIPPGILESFGEPVDRGRGPHDMSTDRLTLRRRVSKIMSGVLPAAEPSGGDRPEGGRGDRVRPQFPRSLVASALLWETLDRTGIIQKGSSHAQSVIVC